jgi:hypothetical protein
MSVSFAILSSSFEIEDQDDDERRRHQHMAALFTQDIVNQRKTRQTLKQQDAFETSPSTRGPLFDTWMPWILLAEGDNVGAHLQLFEYGCPEFQLDSSTTC